LPAFPIYLPINSYVQLISIQRVIQGNYLDLADDEDTLLQHLPEVIVTKRNRTESVCGRIEDDIETGTVKYFCRSRGHGFIVSEKVGQLNLGKKEKGSRKRKGVREERERERERRRER
jgi:hypothetical protein